jgi:hypothetical protein
MSFVEAREKWAAMSKQDRVALIEKLHGDVAAAADDWAALPPQAQSAIMATWFPPGAGAEADDEDEPHARGRRR